MSAVLSNLEAPAARQPRSLVVKMAERFSVEPAKLLDTLKATAFKSQNGVTNEQMMALLVVADQYTLNPFTKEIFAFPDKGGIVPVVSVDGWARIINTHPQFDGVVFAFDAEEGAMTCTMYRKDRTHPTVVTEYMAECKRSTQPWQSHPRRMLRHKTLIQCARVAFGFAGIYDEDEVQRIVHGGTVERVDSAADVRAALAAGRKAAQDAASDTIDVQATQVPDEAPQAPAAPPDEPQAPSGDYVPLSLSDWSERVDAAADLEAARALLRQAEADLTGDEMAELQLLFQRAWTPPPEVPPASARKGKA